MSSGVFRWGPWKFERTEWRLSHRESGPVLLPNKTLELLALLLDCAPSLVEKGEILARVWSGATVEEGNIAFHVAALRRVLDAAGEPSCIETVRARGYRFVAPVMAMARRSRLRLRRRLRRSRCRRGRSRWQMSKRLVISGGRLS